MSTFEKELGIMLEIEKQGIWIKSHLEKEVLAVTINTLKESGVDIIYSLELSSGVYKLSIDNNNNIIKEQVNPAPNGSALLKIFNDIQTDKESMETSAFILKDIDIVYDNPAWSRALREILEVKQNKYTPLIVISPTHSSNVTLDHLFKELSYDDLNEEDIVELLNAYSISRNQTVDTTISKLLIGFDRREIIELLDESYARYDELNMDMLKAKKLNLIKSSGLLEYREVKTTMDDIGGNKRFKAWFEETKLCMQPEAREMGLDLPKGYLALGIPGSSKTYAAEAVANDLGIPFLKLNMSSILTKFVGESERKIAQARLLIESCAPCVLLIDEVEKALGGYQSSNASDSGTLARVFGTVLEMLNDNKNGIFTIMTSNNVKDLPPELTRTGRLDAIWYFSTPTLEERKDIFRVHLNKKGLKVKDADIKSISEQTNEYTGAEIEQIVKVAMKKAYLRTVKEGKKTLKVTLADLEAAKNDVIPVAISSQEKIRDLEEWVKGRALYASEETTTAAPKRKINAKAIKSASELLANK